MILVIYTVHCVSGEMGISEFTVVFFRTPLISKATYVCAIVKPSHLRICMLATLYFSSAATTFREEKCGKYMAGCC